MKIKRIDTYNNLLFSEKVLFQHGAFLVDEKPYEVEIISETTAIIRGENRKIYDDLIEEFRFYSPHIYEFIDDKGNIVKKFPEIQLIEININEIQPSQFYVDEEKIAAISNFIKKQKDIIIQVIPYKNGYISLDGHTRIYYAVMQKWNKVRTVIGKTDDWVYKFVEEAQKRNIFTPKDMKLISHKEYEKKWDQFCDKIFKEDKNE